MKDLYNIIKESLLDNEDEIIDRATKSIHDDLLKNTYFKVGTDGKTIVYAPEPRDFGYGASINDRSVMFSSVEKHMNLYNNIDKIKSSGLKFQPLQSIKIEMGGIQNIEANKILHKFPCMSTTEVNIELFQNGNFDIDFSKVNFPITYAITISGYNCKTIPTITPYKGHLDVVHLSDNGESQIYTTNNVYGWDCDTLIIESSYFKHQGSYGHGPGLIYGYEIEKIQQLIDNNPKAKTIILYDRHLQKYWKVNTKTSKRKFDKLVNKKFNWVRDAYYAAESDVMGWEYKNTHLKPQE